MITIPLLFSVYAAVASIAQPDSNAAQQSAADQLLRMHAADRRAHFETNARALIENASDGFLAVSDGSIRRSTRAEQLAFFEGYFKDATYYEWDDMEPPVVKVSRDATLAWMIVRTRVRRTQKQTTGEPSAIAFVYAGIMLYERTDGRWMRVGNVSTFEPRSNR